MTTVYKFKAYYTDAGVGTAQDPAPTCTVINMADDSKLANAQATTASTNMPGLYSYEYSGADGLDCVAFFATTDTGCDVKQLASYVSEKITTNLNADVAGVEAKVDTIDTNVDAILADTGTDGVKIASGQTVATVTNLTNLPTMPNDWVTASGLKADAVAEIADGVWDEAISGHTPATTFGGKNQKVVPSETINDYKADVSGLATSTEVNAIALLGETVVGSYTVQDILTILAAALAGKATGGGTTTVTFRGVDDASNVIVATVDANGNRSAVTLTV